MAQTLLTKQGAFDADLMNQINAMFTDLYGGGGVLPGLANGALWIGSAGGAAVAHVPTGDVTITNAGVTAIKTSVTLTTPVLGAATGTSLVLSGDCKAATFHAGSTAGATAGPFTAVASINVIAGIVTTLTGS